MAGVEDSGSDYRYWAFISYSHHDEHWAQWLHASLETYRIPKRLRARVTPLEPNTEVDRLFPVCRDRDDLVGGFDLDERIQLALRQSRHLIVVCSPRSAISEYVRKEIETFEAFGREERVLCLVVDGEPGASEQPGSGSAECLSPPLRTRSKSGQLTRCEPLAADARKQKDGKTNAKLKIVASILGVSFDDLKRREDQRRFQRRLRMMLALAGGSLVLAGSFLAALDAGLGGSTGGAFRRWVDRYGLSVMRPVPDEVAIRQKAEALRSTLVSRLEQARGASNVYPARFDGTQPDSWTQNMAVFAILSLPEPPLAVTQNASVLWRAQVAKDFGVPGSKAIPEFWGLMALARRLSLHPDDAEARTLLVQTARVMNGFRSIAEAGGWTMFLAAPGMKQPEADAYSTTMALMALLEMRRAGLPWLDNGERRDELLRSSFDWLVQHFNGRSDPPGWHAGTSSFGASADGLTLQIYGRLLEAEHEAGLRLPDAIAQEIPRHLARVNDRRIDFPVASGEFTYDAGGPNERSEAINFLWYPWAIDCATRWLNRTGDGAASTEESVAIQRLLGQLVLQLGDQALAEATDVWTFSASEMLYGLASILPRD